MEDILDSHGFYDLPEGESHVPHDAVVCLSRG
jgi:hypothetical protein